MLRMPLPAPTSSTTSPGRTTESMARRKASVRTRSQIIERWTSNSVYIGSGELQIGVSHAADSTQPGDRDRLHPVWGMPDRAGVRMMSTQDRKGASNGISGDGLDGGHSWLERWSPTTGTGTSSRPMTRVLPTPSSRRQPRRLRPRPRPAPPPPDPADQIEHLRRSARIRCADGRGVRGGQGEDPRV